MFCTLILACDFNVLTGITFVPAGCNKPYRTCLYAENDSCTFSLYVKLLLFSSWRTWKELGNPCEGPRAETTFDSQGTYLLPVVGRPGTVIFMADRWVQEDLPSSRYIWLPLQWEDGRVRLRWQDTWTLPSP